MPETAPALLLPSYLLLPLWIFAEQMGLPIPSFPILLAVGALAAKDGGSLWLMTMLAVSAALGADLIWFSLGKRYGMTALGRLCRLCIEPDSCVRRTKRLLGERGLSLLLVAKFVPGLNAMAAPSAGAMGHPWRKFLLTDLVGSVIWALTLEWLGYFFALKFGRIVELAAKASSVLLALIAIAGLVSYVSMKYARRRRFLNELRMARITPRELKQKLDHHEPVTIVDLRHSLDFLPEPYTIPGSIRIPMEELERRTKEIPCNAEIVLYCTCPNEASSATIAARLKRHGISRVRPLQGGLREWRSLGFPLESQFGPVPPLKPCLETRRK